MINRQWLQFIIILSAMLLLIILIRVFGIAIYNVPGDGLKPIVDENETLVVNRWSYGLRSGGLFSSGRWRPAAVKAGDLVVYNDPLDTTRTVNRRRVFAGIVDHLPGETVDVEGVALTLPSAGNTIAVTRENMTILCNAFQLYEHRRAEIHGGMLFVDGKEADCVTLSKTYYWIGTHNSANITDSRYFGLVPEDMIIGKVIYHSKFPLFSWKRWKQHFQ